MFINGIDQYLQGVLNAKVVLANANDTTLYTAPSASLFNVSIVSSIIASCLYIVILPPPLLLL